MINTTIGPMCLAWTNPLEELLCEHNSCWLIMTGYEPIEMTLDVQLKSQQKQQLKRSS